MDEFALRWKAPLFFVLLGVLSMAVVAKVPGLALAHGQAIRVEPPQAKPGEIITITGTDFEASETIRITLEGTRGIVTLGSVPADQKGGFIIKATLPQDLAAGSYRVVARQDDETAAVDFTVLEAASQSQPAMAAESAAVSHQPSGPETIAIGIIVAALVVGGVFLVLAGTERRPSLQH